MKHEVAIRGLRSMIESREARIKFFLGGTKTKTRRVLISRIKAEISSLEQSIEILKKDQ